MNALELRSATERDEASRLAAMAGIGPGCCKFCGTRQGAGTGPRAGSYGVHCCADSYFESLGHELDAHPIGALRVVRGT